MANYSIRLFVFNPNSALNSFTIVIYKGECIADYNFTFSYKNSIDKQIEDLFEHFNDFSHSYITSFNSSEETAFLVISVTRASEIKPAIERLTKITIPSRYPEWLV